jgi:23S rRNA (uridine2552-2'-O)-methyltransferase
MEIDDRRRVIPRAGKVLDLGCAPGSWLQVLAERTGEKGRVVGIDLKPVTHEMPERVRTVVGDFTAIDPSVLLGDDGELFDAVFSDMAPNTSGAGDDFLSARLCEEIVDRLPVLLRKGGACVMKVLEGGGTPPLIKRCKLRFLEVKPYKPDATREVSREIYIVCKKYRPPQTPPKPSPDPLSPPPPVEGWNA